MASENYDAIIIGGGNKGLATALYLAKYGGMSVGIFERLYETGGGLCTCEFAGGYSGTPHSAGHFWHTYYDMIHRDFPEMATELEFCSPKYEGAAILEEDHSSMVFYPGKDKSAFEKNSDFYSKMPAKDIEAMINFNKIRKNLAPAFHEFVWNGSTPAGQDDVWEKALKDPANGFDPQWMTMTVAQFLKSYFEKPELVFNLLSRSCLSRGICTDHVGMVPFLFAAWGKYGIPKGGPHAGVHGAVKVLAKYGAKIWTHHEVDNVIIENGAAKGVRLMDGTEVKANKLVLSTLSPSQLVHQLIGDDKVNPKIRRKVDALESHRTCIMWYSFALHEKPEYIAAKNNPDINDSLMGTLNLGDRDLEREEINESYRDQGKHPPHPYIAVLNYNFDGMHAPDECNGGGSYILETFDAPASAFSAEHWMQYTKDHARWMIKEWGKFAPNVTWDNVINYFPTTPYHTSKRGLNFGPNGNHHVIDMPVSQMGRNRPIPELAFHRVPEIKNFYATGTAWGVSQASWSQGYTCYKAIAKDFGLRKPWEEDGRPY